MKVQTNIIAMYTFSFTKQSILTNNGNNILNGTMKQEISDINSCEQHPASPEVLE